jgi:uncharacterized FAD-dependent dehydrogenase
MSNIFDVCIVGCGIAGTFATYKIATQHKNMKTLVVETGRPPSKRRLQMCGFLGLLANGDGKFYLNDLPKIADLTTNRKAKSAYNYVLKTLANVGDFEITKDKSPNISLEKKFKKIGYDISLNNFIQTYPKDVHMLSKYIAETIEQNKNITFSFDNEVKNITKNKKTFIISTDNQEFKAKKVIIAVGRSGWRWANELFATLGIIENNDIARYGIRIEMNSNYMKDFNKSNCTLTKENEIEAGPLCWYGTVIPEDHTNIAISAFRSNEGRWKSDKVSFNFIGSRVFPNKGFEETDRLAGLAFVLANDRILKERISYLLNCKSKISMIPEYDWLRKEIMELGTVMPELLTKGYFHTPTIIPMAAKIKLTKELESNIKGLYVCGESANLYGILSAATSGAICADSVAK